MYTNISNISLYAQATVVFCSVIVKLGEANKHGTYGVKMIYGDPQTRKWMGSMNMIHCTLW